MIQLTPENPEDLYLSLGYALQSRSRHEAGVQASVNISLINERYSHHGPHTSCSFVEFAIAPS
ncbi:MAG: hypothetical protein KME12_27365 [Trichocoleus desertorum ATA4-8-CV12]|jgi:hypothetical protein|nr:hypothetical protein [Trichocoleus desertorum ATA4-8-CV12]